MDKLKQLVLQLFKFGISGIICFIIDYICLYLFSHLFNYLISAAIAYIISTIFNYLLSIHYVFNSKENSKIKEIIIFILLSIIGLFLTEFCMYLFTDICNFYYMLSKIFSTATVMIFNFVTRKIFLEKNLL